MKKNLLRVLIKLNFTLFFILSSHIIYAQLLISMDHLHSQGICNVYGLYSGSSGHTAVGGSYRTDFYAGQGSEETMISTSGFNSAYVAHYDENCGLEYLIGLETNETAYTYDVYMNDDNEIYATGNYRGIMELNPNGVSVEVTATGYSLLVNKPDPFLAKYDSLGILEWYIKPVESGYGYGNTLISSATESIIWAGYYDGYLQFEFEGETITYSDAAADDAFIFEVDSVGEITKHMQVGGNGEMVVDAGCYDSDGNLYLTGFITGSIEIYATDEDYIIETETLNQKFFILKILPDWSIDWHVVSSGQTGYGRGVAINSEGEIVFAGYFSGTQNFPSVNDLDTVTIESAGSRDIFMGKYSLNGDILDLQTLAGPNDDFLTSLLLDEEDQVYLTGSFYSGLDFDPSEDSNIVNTNVGASALFAAKYSSDLDFGWVYYTYSGVSYGESAEGIGIVGDDIMLAGDFHYSVDFNPNGDEVIVFSQLTTDSYLVKLTNPDIVSSFQEFTQTQFELYPNPASNLLTIKSVQEIKADRIVIYDMMGKVVYRKKVKGLYAEQSISLELPILTPGMYIISLEGDEFSTRNFIVTDPF